MVFVPGSWRTVERCNDGDRGEDQPDEESNTHIDHLFVCFMASCLEFNAYSEKSFADLYAAFTAWLLYEQANGRRSARFMSAVRFKQNLLGFKRMVSIFKKDGQVWCRGLAFVSDQGEVSF